MLTVDPRYLFEGAMQPLCAVQPEAPHWTLRTIGSQPAKTMDKLLQLQLKITCGSRNTVQLWWWTLNVWQVSFSISGSLKIKISSMYTMRSSKFSIDFLLLFWTQLGHYINYILSYSPQCCVFWHERPDALSNLSGSSWVHGNGHLSFVFWLSTNSPKPPSLVDTNRTSKQYDELGDLGRIQSLSRNSEPTFSDQLIGKFLFETHEIHNSTLKADHRCEWWPAANALLVGYTWRRWMKRTALRCTQIFTDLSQ